MKARKPAAHKRHLSDKNIQQIIDLLDKWQGPLSWETLLDAVAVTVGQRLTRQGLSNHERIKIAFQVRKAVGDPEARKTPKGSLGVTAAQQKVTALQAKVDRLEKENDLLLSQFARWCHNAALHGLDENKLNAALPPVDREYTRLEPKPGGSHG
jgi:hypothetical protein